LDHIEVRIGLSPKEPWSDVLAAELAGIGYDSFTEDEDGICAYLPAERFNKGELDLLLDKFTGSFSYTRSISTIKGQNWNEIWEKSYKPVWVHNELVIRAPFHDPGDKRPRYEILIEPKMAFGTGHHYTTCLMLEEMLKMTLEGKAVLDMGCGSGILSILAQKQHAEQVLAVDTDEAAVTNALENISLNNCKAVVVEKGGVECLSGREFDVILANINRNALLALMKPFARSLVHQGQLLISGFFETDEVVLGTEATANGLSLKGKSVRHEWCLLHFEKLN